MQEIATQTLYMFLFQMNTHKNVKCVLSRETATSTTSVGNKWCIVRRRRGATLYGDWIYFQRVSESSLALMKMTKT